MSLILLLRDNYEFDTSINDDSVAHLTFPQIVKEHGRIANEMGISPDRVAEFIGLFDKHTLPSEEDPFRIHITYFPDSAKVAEKHSWAGAFSLGTYREDPQVGLCLASKVGPKNPLRRGDFYLSAATKPEGYDGRHILPACNQRQFFPTMNQGISGYFKNIEINLDKSATMAIGNLLDKLRVEGGGE